jgi:oligopeptide/dipeptide ABC transporter ATP-binding protein
MSHLLEVRDLGVEYALGPGRVARAVDGASFTVEEGQTLAVVGESGSGKSTLAHAIMGVLPAYGRFTGGQILFRGRDLRDMAAAELRALRGNEIAMVLQNPMESFDPVYPVGAQLAEAMRAHRAVSAKKARQAALSLMGQVGIPDPQARYGQYPHQFSGGMCQRALIAMALICQPKLLIADEPTSALDVTVQAQIMELLRASKQTYDLAMVLITHDLRLAAAAADVILVMYAGQLVEAARADEVLHGPRHPYTAALLNAAEGSATRPGGRLLSITGSPPELTAIPAGCRFHPRCPHVMDICAEQVPPLEDDGAGHRSACHLAPADRARLLAAPTRRGAEP